MRIYDFTPFYRSSIGFDRMLDLLGSAQRSGSDENGPAYDIERLSEDRYRITMALAGYEPDELTIMSEANALLVEGAKRDAPGQRDFLHRGISHRPFRRQFDLADFVKVAGAFFENGLLAIELEREIPEARKPRRIEIGSAPAPSVSTPKQVETAD